MSIGSYPEAIGAFPNLTSADYIVESTPNDLATEIELIEGALGASGAPQSANVTLYTLLGNYRNNCEVLPVDVSNITIEGGEIVIQDAAGSVTMFKRNASQITIDSGHIDDGAVFQNSSSYNIFAYGDLTSTTFWGVFSTMPAPSAITYYKKIGQMRTDTNGSILGAGNIKGSGYKYWISLWQQITDISQNSIPFNFVDYGSNKYLVNCQLSVNSSSGDGASVVIISHGEEIQDNEGWDIQNASATQVSLCWAATPRYTSFGSFARIDTTIHARLILE